MVSRVAPPRSWERVAAVVLWPLAVGSLLHLAVRSATGTASDLAIFWRSASSFVDGGPLYDPELEFIYPPLAGWFMAPLGLLPFRAAVVLVVVTGLAAVLAGTLLLLRLVGVRAGSAVAAGTLLLLSTSRPVVGLLDQGNVDVVLLLAEAVLITLLLTGRHLWAGALLGLVCAVKPTLAPVLLVLVLLGRVRAVVVAVVVGAALTVVGLVTVPDGAVFLTDVVPLLAEGNREVLAPYDRSIDGGAHQLGVPGAVAALLRLAAFAAACWLVWRRRHVPWAPMEAVPLIMLGTVLAASFSWANYGIYLLPLLVTVAIPGSLVRTWPAWAAVYLFATADAWHVEQLGTAQQTLLRLVPLWGWLLLLGTCIAVELRRAPGERLPAGGAPATAGRSGDEVVHVGAQQGGAARAAARSVDVRGAADPAGQGARPGRRD